MLLITRGILKKFKFTLLPQIVQKKDMSNEREIIQLWPSIHYQNYIIRVPSYDYDVRGDKL